MNAAASPAPITPNTRIVSPGGPVVEATAVRKTFGLRAAVDGIDLALNAGECLVLFGPNGAGKTTLLRLLAGLLKPTSGVVRIAGSDARHDAASRARIGLVSHQSMLYAPLTALENVEFAARLHGLKSPRDAAMTAMHRMSVGDRADVPVRVLSRGLQQRVSIARAIVHSPTLLLFDEPSAGLDESGSHALTSMLQGLRSEGATLAVVTHSVSLGLAIATHAAVMLGGRFAKYESRPGDPERFAAEYRKLVEIGAGGGGR